MINIRNTLFMLSWLSTHFIQDGKAQQTNSEATNLNEAFDIRFPPLADLIDSAMKHNDMIRFRDKGIAVKEASLESAKTYWWRNIGLQADTRYGTFDNFSTNIDNGQSTSLFFTNSKQFNYGVGAYMKFPVYDLINRKNQIKLARSELEQAISLSDAQRDELEQQIIRLYNELLMKQKILKIRSRSLGNAKVNMEMTEKEFRNGIVAVTEYVRISDIVHRVETDYEIAKAEFNTAYMLMENLTGLRFGTPTIKSDIK